MTKLERLKWLKEIEKDIYVCSLESTFADDSKSCAIHSAIEELEKDTSGVIEELEKVRAKIIKKANSGQWSEPTIYGMQKAVFIIDNELSELKGEQE